MDRGSNVARGFALKRDISIHLSTLNVFIVLAFVAVTISIGTLECQAHKINVFALVEKDSLVVEGYFAGNVKAQDSLVQVYAQSGDKIAEGRTDTKGIYRIGLNKMKPIRGDLRVVISTGDGHRAEYVVKAAEIPSSLK